MCFFPTDVLWLETWHAASGRASPTVRGMPLVLFSNVLPCFNNNYNTGLLWMLYTRGPVSDQRVRVTWHSSFRPHCRARRAQLYRLFAVLYMHTLLPRTSTRENKSTFVTVFFSWHLAPCKSVYCHVMSGAQLKTAIACTCHPVKVLSNRMYGIWLVSK